MTAQLTILRQRLVGGYAESSESATRSGITIGSWDRTRRYNTLFGGSIWYLVHMTFNHDVADAPPSFPPTHKLALSIRFLKKR